MAAAKNSALSSSLAGVASVSWANVVSLAGSAIDDLQKKAGKADVLQKLISDTQRLQKELKLATKAGDASVGSLRAQLKEHQAQLRMAGLSLKGLDKTYDKLERVTRGTALLKAGQERLAAGKEQFDKTVQRIAVPVKAAADFQASVRSIAINGGFANTAQEGQVAGQIRQAADQNGMQRNELAGLVGQLVSHGVKAGEAASYSGLIAKFSVGQGVSGEDTAKLVQSLSQSAGIKDAAGMGQALERLAATGQASGMGSASMAKAFPDLLAEMARNGVTGQAAVDQLSSMLQVQQQMQGSADPAATAEALKAWLSKQAGAGAGKAPALLEDYGKSMQTGGADHDARLAAALAKATPATPAGTATTVLDQSLAARQQTSAYKWQEVANAHNAAMESMGRAMQPVTNLAADAASGVLRFGTSLIEAHPRLAAVAGTAFVGANLLGSAWKVGRGALEIARGTYSLASSGMLGKLGKELSGKVGKADELLGGAKNEVQQVFVVNFPGRGSPSRAGAKLGRATRKSPAASRASKSAKSASGSATAKAGQLTKVSKPAKAAPRPRTHRAGERLAAAARPAKAARRPTPGRGPAGRGLGGRVGAGVALASGLYAAVSGAESGKGKAKEALTAGGGWAGGLAGARLGAMVGALGGPVGMAVGGVIGGVVGSIGGEKIGTWLGDKLFPEATPATAAAGQPSTSGLPTTAAMGAPVAAAAMAAPASFSPNIQITVQGDVKDPRQLANELMPYLQTMFDQFRAQSGRGAMYDVAPEW